MPRFILAILALILLLAGILIVAPGLIPVKAYKGRLEAEASKVAGRAVTIGDDISFKLVPKTAFRATDLQIANAEGFDDPYLTHVKAADIGVKLFPLLSGSIQIDRFVLTEPDIRLARNRNGDVNWNLAKSERSDRQGSEPRELKLGDVRIVDGKAAFADGASGKSYRFDDIDLAVRLDSLAEPLEVDGTLRFEGAPSSVKLVLTSLSKILDKEPANLKLDLKLGDATAGADVVVETADALAYSGPMSLNAPDLPAFARLLGAKIEDGPGFDKLLVEGSATGGANSLNLAAAKVGFDAIDATGDIGLAWGGARPKASGRLETSSLDLRPYLPPPSQGAKGFPAWSEAKIDFASLRNIDADLDLSADKIFLNDLEFGESELKLKIEDGRMVADLPTLGMYGGAASGQLVVNARQATPAITGKFDAGSVQAQPFTMDLMKTDRLLGLGGFKLDFSASGSSQAAIMRTLDGNGGFDVADGAIKGVNLAKLARTIDEIRQGGINPSAIAGAIAAAQQPDEKTDFSELLSAFAIADGQVAAPTINLKGPFITMTGVGDINLPGQRLDLRLAPRATTTIDGQGGRAIAIPVRVTGTFAKPKLSIDLEALLRGQLEGGLRDFFNKAFQKKEGTDGEATDAEAEETTPESAARDILKGVLGGGKEPSAESEEPDGAQSTSDPAAPETILNDALKGIFGGKPKPATTPAAEETPAPPAEATPPVEAAPPAEAAPAPQEPQEPESAGSEPQ